MNIDQTFTQALEAAKSGYMISRKGAGEWRIFYQVPSTVPAAIIPKMSSLPNSVKTLFHHRGGDIRYIDQFGLISPDNTITGWIPRTEDLEASDWVIHMEPQMDFAAAPVAETVGTASPTPIFTP